MKNFIKEFGDDQSHKKLPAKFEPEVEWGFEPDIKHEPLKDPDDINPDDLKSFAVEVVLKYMNESTISIPEKFESRELFGKQKEEILEKIKLYESRPGFMSMTFYDDVKQDECILGARIDPTNNKDWILTKEEIICKLPYSYKNSLYRLFNEVRKK